MKTALGARLAVKNISPRTPNGCKAWDNIERLINRAILDDYTLIEFPIKMFRINADEYVFLEDYEIHNVVKALKSYGYSVEKTNTENNIILTISWRA